MQDIHSLYYPGSKQSSMRASRSHDNPYDGSSGLSTAPVTPHFIGSHPPNSGVEPVTPPASAGPTSFTGYKVLGAPLAAYEVDSMGMYSAKPQQQQQPQYSTMYAHHQSIHQLPYGTPHSTISSTGSTASTGSTPMSPVGSLNSIGTMGSLSSFGSIGHVGSTPGPIGSGSSSANPVMPINPATPTNSASSPATGFHARSYSAAYASRNERLQPQVQLSLDTNFGRPRAYSSGMDWNKRLSAGFGGTHRSRGSSPTSAFPLSLASPMNTGEAPRRTASFSASRPPLPFLQHPQSGPSHPVYGDSSAIVSGSPILQTQPSIVMSSPNGSVSTAGRPAMEEGYPFIPVPVPPSSTINAFRDSRSVGDFNSPNSSSGSNDSNESIESSGASGTNGANRANGANGANGADGANRENGSESKGSNQISDPSVLADSTTTAATKFDFAGIDPSAKQAANKSCGEAQIDLLTASPQRIYALCRDQRGCRYLQRRLIERDPAICSTILEATIPHIVTLMMDPFGNYFCQKLIEHCNEREVTTILRACAPHLVEIAQSPHGTRALQKTLEALKTHEQVDLVINALNGSVVKLIKDLNGNHVIQKLLLELDEYGTQFVYDSVCASIIEVGSHRHGCCVLQRCLDYSKPLNRHRLVSHIVAEAPKLVVDQFGNYVCQYVVDLAVPEYSSALIYRLLGQIADLSMQKFASNVVEKCLRTAAPPLQRAMISELLVPDVLHQMLLDSYGNYVVQTALSSSDGELQQALVVAVQSHLSQTRSPYGRRILAKLKTLPAAS